MELLIDYLHERLKFTWILKENSLTVFHDLFQYDFIEEVSKYQPIEFINVANYGQFTICFNANGINDKSNVIAMESKSRPEIKINVTVDSSLKPMPFCKYNPTITGKTRY